MFRQLDDLEDLSVHVEQLHARHLALRERADARDDLAGSLAVGRDVIERRPRFRHIGRIGREPARARTRVRHDRAQRLVDLVRDRSGQLAQRGQPRHADELGPRDVQGIVFRAHDLLRALAFADVACERQVKSFPLWTNVLVRISTGKRCHPCADDVFRRSSFRRPGPLASLRNRRIIEEGIEFAWVGSDQLFADQSQAQAGLAIHVDEGEILVQQKEYILAWSTKCGNALRSRAARPRPAAAR